MNTPSKHAPKILEQVHLEKIVGEGKTLATLPDGKKLFVWGGLPGEVVDVQVTKKKSKLLEGIVTEVHTASPLRVAAKDPDSFLSTSPWQIISLDTENQWKSDLVTEAFTMHDVVLPQPSEMVSVGPDYGYRNKIEFSFWWDKEEKRLDLAFFRRGSHQKIEVEGTSLAHDAINAAGIAVRDLLRTRTDLDGMALKTLLIRCNQAGEAIAQLYVKDETFAEFSDIELGSTGLAGFELIHSNPQSPASVITKRLQQWGKDALTDTILDIPFRYATEGFFQINLPVYEAALQRMQKAIPAGTQVIDLYSGVGTIGLTIGGDDVTLVELNPHAVREMETNIAQLGKTGAKAILAASENALDIITQETTVIVDPPRAGLHESVVDRLLEVKPRTIIYLSCNPSTQARDVGYLTREGYSITDNVGYNFFPHTPHIEHLIVLTATDTL